MRSWFFGTLWLCVACGARSELMLPDQSTSGSSGGSSDSPSRRCPIGFAECDDAADTICETETASSNTDCGACGVVCPSGRYCGQGVCRDPADIVQIDSSIVHTCAVSAEGRVFCWGSNRFGVLGVGLGVGELSDFEATPQEVSIPERVVEIRAGAHCCARTEVGELWCWGGGDRSRRFLGPESSGSSDVPVRSHVVEEPARLSMGSNFTTFVLKRDGSLVGWGDNRYSQLGEQDEPVSSEPVSIPGVPSAIQISARSASCALSAEGEVWCWGDNVEGEVGDGTSTERAVPARVGTFSDARAIATGAGNTCMVDAGGATWCWGLYGALQYLGQASHEPVLVSGISDAIGVSSGRYHACAVSDAGRVKCWGTDYHAPLPGMNEPITGALGRGEDIGGTAESREVSGIDDVVSIAAGTGFTCALRRDGRVFCWGYNEFGQLGNGTTDASNTPVEVIGLR